MSATLIQILIHFDYVYSELVLASYTLFFVPDLFLSIAFPLSAARTFLIGRPSPHSCITKAIVSLRSRSHYSHASLDNRQIKYRKLQCFTRQSPAHSPHTARLEMYVVSYYLETDPIWRLVTTIKKGKKID